MGRLRASLLDITGVKFDKTAVNLRLLQLGVTDNDARAKVLAEMQKAHTRDMFLQVLYNKGKTNGR